MRRQAKKKKTKSSSAASSLALSSPTNSDSNLSDEDGLADLLSPSRKIKKKGDRKTRDADAGEGRSSRKKRRPESGLAAYSTARNSEHTRSSSVGRTRDKEISKKGAKTLPSSPLLPKSTTATSWGLGTSTTNLVVGESARDILERLRRDASSASPSLEASSLADSDPSADSTSASPSSSSSSPKLTSSSGDQQEPPEGSLSSSPTRLRRGTSNLYTPAQYERLFRLRRETILELFETEKLYLRDLSIMITLFREPIVQKQLLPAADVATIFSNLTVLKNVNKQMVADLSKVVAPPSQELELGELTNDALIAPVFLQFADILKVYSFYCNGQVQAFDAVEQCKKKYPAFAKFVEEQMNNPETHGLQLISYLIKPTQRICKYPLLLRELLANTPRDHPDYKPLQEAMAKVELIVSSINESSRAAENVRQIIQIQARIMDGEKFGFVSPSRRFLVSEKFQIQEKDGHYREYEWFLFSDLLVGTRKPPKAKLLGKRGNLVIKHWILVRFIEATLLPSPPQALLHFGVRLNVESGEALTLYEIGRAHV